VIPRGKYIGKLLGEPEGRGRTLHPVPSLRGLDRLSRSRPIVRARGFAAETLRRWLTTVWVE
jgi:hypothetical protein